ncbi:MAG: TM0106 family RecB-like putative nuclease [Candidatus Altimarinota bacterium]
MTFTPSLFYLYSKTPLWIWHDCFSDPAEKGELSELAQKLVEEGVLHEQEYINGLKFEAVEEIDPMLASMHTLELMKQGTELIYQGELQGTNSGVNYRGRPDLLEKVPGSSNFGDYHYLPVDIKSTTEPKKEHKMQLCLYAMLLKQVQGVFPEKGIIINRDGERKDVLFDTKLIAQTETCIEEILEIIRGKKPDLEWSRAVKDCPWGDKVLKECEAAQDLCLIYHEHLHSSGHAKLRELGIRTVQDVAQMDVKAMPKIPYNPPERLERGKLQAQALLDKQIKWLKPPEIPEAPLQLFFDIEGDPLLDIDYLFGFWVAGDPEKKFAKIGHVKDFPAEQRYFLYFLAEKPDDEAAMWKQFLDWLELIKDEEYLVYHYAMYEKVHVKDLGEYYGSSEALETFQSRLVDLFEDVKKSVIFPLYFYSIKDLAKSKFIDYKWRNAKAGGAQSIFWYEEWLEKADRRILQDVIDYNEDDVRATEALYEWMKAQGEVKVVMRKAKAKISKRS